MSPLVLGEILGVFINTLSADVKYPVQDCKNFQLPIQIQLSEKRRTLSKFLLHFWNLNQILNILKEKMIVIANVFRKIIRVKNLVRTLSKGQRFSTGLGSQHVKAFQIVPKFPWTRFYHVFSSFSKNLIWKMSLAVLGEILGVFVNTLTADSKYPAKDCKNFPLSIQIPLYEKRKSFSQVFVPFLESISNLKHFEWKDDCNS